MLTSKPFAALYLTSRVLQFSANQEFADAAKQASDVTGLTTCG